MKKETKKGLISWGITLFLFGCFVWYIVTHWHDFLALKIVSFWYAFFLILLTLLSYWVMGITNQAMFRPFKLNLSLHESFALAIITGFYNVITPFRGGMIVRALYLKEKYNFSFTQFIASLSGITVITMFVAALSGFTSVLIMWQQTGVFNVLVALIFIAMALPCLIIMLWAPKFPESKHRYFNKIIAVINGWHDMSRKKSIIVLITVLTLVSTLLGVAVTSLSYGVLGIQLTIAQAMYLTAMNSIAIVIQITPAGLGVNEAIAVFSGLVIGITPAQSIVASLLARLLSFVVLFTLGPIYSYLLLKRNHTTKPTKAY